MKSFSRLCFLSLYILLIFEIHRSYWFKNKIRNTHYVKSTFTFRCNNTGALKNLQNLQTILIITNCYSYLRLSIYIEFRLQLFKVIFSNNPWIENNDDDKLRLLSWRETLIAGGVNVMQATLFINPQ